jgi:uncharacterized membrane protein
MKKATIFIILIILVAASLLFYYYEGARLNLVPQPERFTELYFIDSSNLPRQTVAKQPISFSFGIHNVEYMTMTYPYEVYLMYTDGHRLSIASGTITLPNDASTTIPVSYTFGTSNVTTTVVVALPAENNQSIDFLLPSTD